jgi:hypothetical protein
LEKTKGACGALVGHCEVLATQKKISNDEDGESRSQHELYIQENGRDGDTALEQLKNRSAPHPGGNRTGFFEDVRELYWPLAVQPAFHFAKGALFRWSERRFDSECTHAGFYLRRPRGGKEVVAIL